MYVIEQARPVAMSLPGIEHATWVGHDDGLQQLSIWRQSMAPGTGTPPHSHDCDEVVLCLAGRGELLVGGGTLRFGADDTLVLPKGVVHQFFSVGPQPLETVGILGSSPAPPRLPDGQLLELPWRS